MRPTSRVIRGENGLRYRITPIDDRHEIAKRIWDREHMIVISTKIDRDMYRRYREILDDGGCTIYEDLRQYVETVVRLHEEEVE